MLAELIMNVLEAVRGGGVVGTGSPDCTVYTRPTTITREKWGEGSTGTRKHTQGGPHWAELNNGGRGIEPTHWD